MLQKKEAQSHISVVELEFILKLNKAL